MEDFLKFRKFITPVAIQVIFWLGVAVTLIAGIVAIGAGKVQGLLMIIFGPIVVRIYCELLMVVFRIYDTLVEVRDKTAGSPAPKAASSAV